ncbi:MAG: OmpA family protein, partial [Bacteroidota bacterium]
YSGFPLGWFYKGSHFTDLVKYWDSPTQASPDVFGPRIHVPQFWKEKGFGEKEAKEGSSMIGITVFGCKDGKPHCREYVQVRLKDPLVVGQNYEISFFTAHLPNSLRINNLGVHLSVEAIEELTEGPLDQKASLHASSVVTNQSDEWYHFKQIYKADKAYEFLVLGNFHLDEQTEFRATDGNSLKYAYYYIDNVSIRKVEPIIQIPNEVNIFESLVIEEGKIIQLENIYFDLDKANFLPRSYDELDKLLGLMKKHPSLEIEIHGHTDNQGSSEYNQKLSLSRAKAVSEYLNDNGIEKFRTSFKGFGSSKPIDTNETAQGRRKNRRVEFLIVRF